ncbi:MAG: hypothetical protein ACI837_000159 [Crocinitomicaceae bacterium]|jgi:hypothetical protein
MISKLMIAFLFFALLPSALRAQNESAFIGNYSDSTNFRIIIKTQNKVEGDFITLDVFTIKGYEDSTKVYYIRYGDMLISSLMMEYSILDKLVAFEEKANSLACIEEAQCINQILIEGASNSYTIPMDILNEELLSNLMLELEK